MKKKLTKYVTISFSVLTLLFSCTVYVENLPPSAEEMIVGKWSSYYSGIFYFETDRTFYNDIGDGYILFGNWRISGNELILIYESDYYENVLELTELTDYRLVICPIDVNWENPDCEEYIRE